MLAKTPIDERFYRWVAAQPPEKAYDYCDSYRCACGTFLHEELGYGHNDILRMKYSDDEIVREIWLKFDLIALGDPVASPTLEWTYGALARRIREQMPEVV